MKKLILGLFIGVTLAVTASQMVYVTPNGKRYHATDSCRSLRRSKIINKVKITNVGGRTPCKICY